MPMNMGMNTVFKTEVLRKKIGAKPASHAPIIFPFKKFQAKTSLNCTEIPVAGSVRVSECVKARKSVGD